jgi:hypothetical protein
VCASSCCEFVVQQRLRFGTQIAGYGGLSRMLAGREVLLTDLLLGFFLVSHDESVSK